MWLRPKPAVLLQAMIIYVQHTCKHACTHRHLLQESGRRALLSLVKGHKEKYTVKKRTKKYHEIIQSHRDYSFKKMFSSPAVSSGCCMVTQRKDCNTQQSSYVTCSGQNRSPKSPWRNRRDEQRVKGVREVAAAPLGIMCSALDLLADEGGRSGDHSTAFPGPFLPAASTRGLQHVHCLPLCTGEVAKNQKSYDIPPEKRVTALLEPVHSSHLSSLGKALSVFWV